MAAATSTPTPSTVPGCRIDHDEHSPPEVGRAYSRAMFRRLLMVLAVLCLGVGVSPAVADSDVVIKVAHPAVTANLHAVTPGVASPGDIRTFYAKLTKPGKSARIGFMTGSLLTT